MSGSASAGTQQAGTIGTATDPVDVESDDINNADTVTTQDLVVNGTATGPFGADLQGCRAFLSADQSLPLAPLTKVEFDSITYDSGNNFDTTNHQFVCPETGLYAVNVKLAFNGGNFDDEKLIVIGDGSTSFPFGGVGVRKTRREADVNDSFIISTLNKYNKNDTIAAYAKNDDSNDNIEGGGDQVNLSFFEAAFLGTL
jgi:hypothetical protein